jgi:RNA polymerase subunit RPABC4/transcription elongation factor Spt4
MVKKVDEIFCSECGAVIKAKAEICPKCGCRVKDNTDDRGVNFNTNDSSKPAGSLGWLIFWILFCFPVAILYYLMRRWN